MASELSRTLARFARAKLATWMPYEAFAEFREAVRESTHADRVARARRANLTRVATGRLVFADDPGRPLRHVEVELWDREPVGLGDYLGADLTDAEGRFEIPYDPGDAGGFDDPDLQIQVWDRFRGERRLVYLLDGEVDVTDLKTDLGDCSIPFYAYRQDLPLPHIAEVDAGSMLVDSLPQTYAVKRRMAMARIASKVLPVRLRHYASGTRALSAIQDDYRKLTSYRSPDWPDDPDARFVHALLSGASPATFSETPDGRLHVVHTWDRYAVDGAHRLPNVHLILTREEGGLTPHALTLCAREPGKTGAFAPVGAPVTHHPGDPGWREAAHVFGCVHYVHGQLADHLARAHFNVEQFALAAWRNLRLSPLKDLLLPHLQEVVVVNTEGEEAVFGPHGLITRNSALTEASVVQALTDHASTLDWWGWRPREPLGPGHHYAHAASLFWKMLYDVVDAFLAEHLDGVLTHWSEIVGFSRDLVAHSVPHTTPSPPDGHDWRCTREVADPNAPRQEVGGALRTMSPITTSDTPTEQALRHLAQATAYAIFHATFFHSWVNDTHRALEPDYVQYNPVPDSSTRELTDHISLELLRSEVRHGHVLANEDGEVHPRLVEGLRGIAEALATHGVDAARIRSRINI